jgi:hypothetical protein
VRTPPGAAGRARHAHRPVRTQRQTKKPTFVGFFVSLTEREKRFELTTSTLARQQIVSFQRETCSIRLRRTPSASTTNPAKRISGQLLVDDCSKPERHHAGDDLKGGAPRDGAGVGVADGCFVSRVGWESAGNSNGSE